MSDTHAAPDAGAGDLSPVSVITPAADTAETLSPMQAARALAQARWNKNKQPEAEAAPVEAAPEAEQVSAQAEDAAPDDPAPGETTETAEPAEQPPIEPPRSWTKEAKERWQSLPRETQEYLAQREQERDREFRRSQNEAAEERKAIKAQADAAEKARQQYEAALPTLMQTLQDAQAGTFSDIKTVDDVTKLASEDPFRYLQWQAHQTKMQAVQAEMRAAQERQTTEQQSKWTDHVQKEEAQVLESLSDADRAKWKEFQSEAPEFLEGRGFTRQELSELASGKDRLSIYDHRVQLLILDGIKYQAAQKAAKTVAAKPVPQVQKPGTAQPRGAAQAEAISNLTAKLERSGSLRDAVALRVAQQKGRA